MRTTLEKVTINFPAAMPCISNVSALPFSSIDDLKDLLSRQCVETVRWWDSIKYLDQEQGVKRWVGLGPGKVGRNLVGKEVGRITAKGGGVWAICDPRDVEDTMEALARTELEY
jgi:[acyl-carrier-protein] S-malonyltransferase